MDFVTPVGEIPGGTGTSPVTTFIQKDDGLAEIGLVANNVFTGIKPAMLQAGQFCRFG